MSKLDDLIQKLCPDGVEYKPLSEIFNTRNGYTPSKKEKNFWENGTVPWFRMEDIRENGGILDHAMQYVSINAIKGDPFPANSIIVATSATIGEHALITVPSIANQRFTYLMVKEQYKDDYDPKFLYYYCFKLDEYCKECLNQGNFASVDMKKFAKFQFPRLPIEIQREIVRMLDSYTESVVELQRQLTAELTARKTQYNYYRDYLLSYKDNVKKYTIAELADTNIGLATSVTQHKRNSGIVLIHNSDIQPNKVVLKSIEYVSEEFAEKNKKKVLRKGDIITVHTGDVGTSAVIDDAFDGAIGFTTITTRIRDRKKITPKYLCHYLNSQQCKRDIESVTISDRNNLNQKSYEKLTVPVPPLDVQNRIVNVLDNFEKICSDLNIGLPAEIEARQKQYEYYRDKLLSFKEHKNELSD